MQDVPHHRHPLSREEVAQIEIGATEVSSRLARFLVVCFLVAIFCVPIAQHASDVMQWRAAQRPSPMPQAWDILLSVRHAVYTWYTSTLSLYDRVFAVNHEFLRDIQRYEGRLEEESWLTRHVLPPVQLILSRGLGVGNEQAYLGRDGWLFYRPAIEYLTGPGFLAPRQLAHRATSSDASSPPPQPDPVQAIVQFRTQLAERGIDLILMPVPGKPSVHPEHFVRGVSRDAPVLHNRSFRAFLHAMEAKGVRVFDPSDRLAAFADAHGTPAYLATDTHWTPAAMENIAVALADELRPLLSAPVPGAVFRRDTATVTNLGDLGKMLRLPQDSPWPAPETAEIHPVRPVAEDAVRVLDPAADVLLLGDSFANIYALESMGWGTSAGLAEHLALALNRPVDAIRHNDAGAYATRETLARELAQGRDRLAGKKVVVWEFAARELAQGDWRLLDLQPPRASGAPLRGVAGLQTLTGSHARIVWMQAVDPASTDTFGRGDGFRLMGLDTEDGRGIREILPGPLSCRRPLLTPDGQRVVFTDYPRGRVVVVDWDGSNRREVADGFATDVKRDPQTGRTWVYAVAELLREEEFAGKPLLRFDLERPEVRQTMWEQTEVTLDNFQISDDGHYAAGLFPWPYAGVADLRTGTWTPIGRGCWTSLAPDTSGLAWFFDGAHRNLLFADGTAQDTWKVPIHLAPGVDGFEVYHPRWGNHRRFFSMTGPYKGGQGDNRIGAAGREVEIYVGRFSEDLRRVERWAQITADGQPDFFPDLWIDPARPPAFSPDNVEAPQAAASVAMGPIVVDARLTAVTRTPTLQSIAPYRQALVVYAYEVVKVHAGINPGPRILVHHWALHNDRTVVPRTRVGETVRLAVEPFDDHPELQGERVVKDMEESRLPLFYEPPG